MWHNWGRLEVGPHPYPQKTLVFQWDEGSVGVGRVEQRGGGAQRMGRAGVEIKEGEHFHTPFFVEALHLWRGRDGIFLLNPEHFHSHYQIPKNQRCSYHLGVWIIMSGP